MIQSVHQSHLGMWLRCQEMFRRRYIEGEICPPGIAARQGSAVHKAAEVNHVQKIKTEEDLPLDCLTDAARDEYVRLVKDGGIFIPRADIPQKTKLLGQGLDNAVTLTKLYRDQLAPIIFPVLAEEKIIIEAGLVLPLEGTLDLVTKADALEDIKTAAKTKPVNEADKSLQLTFYSGLYAHQFKKWPKQTNLRVLANTATPKLQTLESSRGPADFSLLLSRIKLMLAQIQTGLFMPCDPASWICDEKWCGYALTCRFYRRK